MKKIVAVRVWGDYAPTVYFHEASTSQAPSAVSADSALTNEDDDFSEWSDMADPESAKDWELLSDSDVSLTRKQSALHGAEEFCVDDVMSDSPEMDEELPSRIWVTTVEAEPSILAADTLDGVDSLAYDSESDEEPFVDVDSDPERSVSPVNFSKPIPSMPLTLGFLASPRQLLSPVVFHDHDEEASVGTTVTLRRHGV